ncbi:MAG: YibE/F family protein [Chloroflexota bacterium]
MPDSSSRFAFIRGDVAALAIVLAILVLLVGVAPRAFHVATRQAASPTVTGTVVRVVEEHSEPSERGQQRIRTLEVAVGDHVVTVEEATADGDVSLVPPQPGDGVLVQSTPGPDGQPAYYIVDHLRTRTLWLITALFAALVVFVGRWYGIRSLLSLAVTYLLLMRFIIPAILSGYSPLLVSVVGGIGIMASTLVLAHGVDRKSGAAIGGTALALVLIVTLSQVAIIAAKLTGLVGNDEASTVFVLFGGAIDARGLLLSGILIGALGALDDVTMTQASAVFELRDANPSLHGRALYQRGMRIGRDHIASIVNTLVLAYAGASMPLLVILASQTEGVGTLLNREFLASEVVRTAVGSIGIVAAVPLTTAIAAMLAAGQTSSAAPVRLTPPEA